MLERLGMCVLFSIYNCVTDWKNGKIRNASVFLFACIAVLSQLIEHGGRGLLNAFGAAVIPLVMLPLFAVRMLGAGDIKALMAIGLMVGFPAILYILAYSFLGAGVIAVAVMLIRKNGKERFRQLWNYCKCRFYGLPVSSYNGIDSSGAFRFSFGILAGVIVYVIQWLAQ